jgi:hypothetical protein
MHQHPQIEEPPLNTQGAPPSQFRHTPGLASQNTAPNPATTRPTTSKRLPSHLKHTPTASTRSFPPPFNPHRYREAAQSN